jgi:lysophospholipid acyltransferase
MLRKTVRPIFITGPLSSIHIVYDVLGRFCAMFFLNYLVVAFILKDASVSLSAWKSVYFLGHMMVFVPIILLQMLGLSRILKQYHKTEEKKNL